jgi:lipopolysaccharide export system protein LptC
MTDPRTSSYRFRLAVLLAIATVLALGSFWVLDVMRRSMDEVTPQVKRSEPDYYVEQFHFIRAAKTGEGRYAVSGTRMVHYPSNDTYEIQQPIVKSLRKNEPPMTIRADRALADPNTNQVQLFDNVQADRPASAQTKPMHLSSEYLLVLPDDDIVKTDHPVQITFADAVLRGTGMLIDHAHNEFKLDSHVRGVFPPKALQ